jgi:hypothetical protein
LFHDIYVLFEDNYTKAISPVGEGAPKWESHIQV